jgi:DNA repair protein RadC
MSIPLSGVNQHIFFMTNSSYKIIKTTKTLSYDCSEEEKAMYPEASVSYIRKTHIKHKIRCSSDMRDYFLKIYNPDTLSFKEYFYLLFMNQDNSVISHYKLSEGGRSGTVADPKVIFQVALLLGASAIALSHNHPSGNTKPSTADVHLTKKIQDGANILDIRLLDHIIITPEGKYFSFTDEGLL